MNVTHYVLSYIQMIHKAKDKQFESMDSAGWIGKSKKKTLKLF